MGANRNARSADDDVTEVSAPPGWRARRPDMCRVCRAAKIDTIFIPCRHACVCEACYDALPVPKVCPACRRNVIKTLHVILDS